MKPVSFFWSEVSGIKKDYLRHARKRKELEQRIADLEAVDSCGNEPYLRTYRHLLNQLNASMATVTAKIGVKK